MVLLLVGARCNLCEKPIDEKDEIVTFPAFLPTYHRFARFSDTASHGDCFRRDQDSPDVQALFSRYREIWASRPKALQTPEQLEAWGREAFKEFRE